MMVAVGEAFARLDNGIPDIEISVGGHVPLDAVNKILDIAFKLLVLFSFKHICRRFHPLRRIGIVEEMRAVGLALLPLAAKRGKSSGVLKSAAHAVERHGLVELNAVFPESACDIHFIKRYRALFVHIIVLSRNKIFKSQYDFLGSTRIPQNSQNW